MSRVSFCLVSARRMSAIGCLPTQPLVDLLVLHLPRLPHLLPPSPALPPPGENPRRMRGAVPALERPAHFGGRVVAFVPNLVDQEIDGLLRRPDAHVEVEREDDASAAVHAPATPPPALGGAPCSAVAPRQPALPAQPPPPTAAPAAGGVGAAPPAAHLVAAGNHLVNGPGRAEGDVVPRLRRRRSSSSLVMVGYETEIRPPPREHRGDHCASGLLLDLCRDSLAIWGTVMRSFARR